MREIPPVQREYIDFEKSVKDKDLATPPGSPAVGHRYIVATGGTGAWSGHDTEIPEWTGATWAFTVPDDGCTTFVEDENLYYTFDGAAWNPLVATPTLHASTHETGGTDEINVASLSGQLADLQLPVDHTHQSAGSGVGSKLDHGNALTSASRAHDDHSGYPWLLGRTGGQTLYGSTQATEDLILYSNSVDSLPKVSLLGASAFRVEAATSILMDLGDAAGANLFSIRDNTPAVVFSVNSNGEVVTYANITMQAGMTVDGVDISVHAADVDAHHPQLHAASHSGSDPVYVETLRTTEAASYKVIRPAGTNALAWVDAQLKAYSQAAEPTLPTDDDIAVWVDTDDSNRTWLVYRRGTGDQVKVELASHGKAHALGGGDHTADTFANLDGKVSDKSLVNLEDQQTFLDLLTLNEGIILGNASPTAALVTFGDSDYLAVVSTDDMETPITLDVGALQLNFDPLIVDDGSYGYIYGNSSRTLRLSGFSSATIDVIAATPPTGLIAYDIGRAIMRYGDGTTLLTFADLEKAQTFTGQKTFQYLGNSAETEFTDDDATPSVSAKTAWYETYANPTNVTDFDGAIAGQIITIRGTTGNFTIVHDNTKIVTLTGGNITLPNKKTISFKLVGGVWYQTGGYIPKTIRFFKDVAINGQISTLTGKIRQTINVNGALSITLKSVRTSIDTAPGTQSILTDLNKNGVSVFTTQANRPAIAAAANDSGEVTNMDITSFVNGDYITWDIDQRGIAPFGSDYYGVAEFEAVIP